MCQESQTESGMGYPRCDKEHSPSKPPKTNEHPQKSLLSCVAHRKKIESIIRISQKAQNACWLSLTRLSESVTCYIHLQNSTVTLHCLSRCFSAAIRRASRSVDALTCQAHSGCRYHLNIISYKNKKKKEKHHGTNTSDHKVYFRVECFVVLGSWLSNTPLLPLAVRFRDRNQSKSQFQRFSALRAGPIHSPPVRPADDFSLLLCLCLFLPL